MRLKCGSDEQHQTEQTRNLLSGPPQSPQQRAQFISVRGSEASWGLATAAARSGSLAGLASRISVGESEWVNSQAHSSLEEDRMKDFHWRSRSKSQLSRFRQGALRHHPNSQVRRI